jgi:outer membrane biosynthesis protein TonB
MQYSAMSLQFESEKNRKAFIYTASICAAMLLLFILFKWPRQVVLKEPITQDLIAINLGNESEGWGEDQPLIKGEMSPEENQPAPPKEQAAAPVANEEPARDITDDNETDADAAAVTKPPVKDPEAKKITDKPTSAVTKPSPNPTPSVAPAPTPRKPRITYNGPGNGNGNGATEDNGYRMQGNNPNGTGDRGNPNGRPDSYGNSPTGRTGAGGPRVTGGDRKIIKYYAFQGDLEKATIYAQVKVSPDGSGTFIGFGKNSTARSAAYAEAIRNYLRNVQFDKSDHESTVTVQFNFTVK